MPLGYNLFYPGHIKLKKMYPILDDFLLISLQKKSMVQRINK